MSPGAFGLMMIGIIIGMVVGILPGLGGPVALALMLPFTFGMTPIETFCFLLSTLVVTTTAGGITSILFGIPGEATAAAIVLDGHPMAKAGEAGRAIGAMLMASLMGALIGAVLIVLAIPIIRPVVLAFGPPEFLMLALVGLTFIAILSDGSMLKGLIMASAGILISLVGLDPQTSVPRYTFGMLEMWDGIGIVPIVIGLFGGPQILELMLSKKSISTRKAAGSTSGILKGFADAFIHWKTVVQAGLIGAGVGVVPGVGGSVAQFIAYGHAKQSSREPEKFGKGSIEGLLAASGNNNAKDGGSLIPMISFGLPGSVSTTIVLTAFLIVGIDPGPAMLTEHLDVTFSMIWVTIIANVIVLLITIPIIAPLSRLTMVSGPLLAPFLLALVVLGSYANSNSLFDVWVMLVAAAVGVICQRFRWPVVPLLLGLVLGDICERYFFLSQALFGWDWVTRPIVMGFGALMALIFFRAGLQSWKTFKNKRAVQ
ncbi:tripartite tricarboxylate transporter permease [Roseisalinus antarcticus]|nr:tripartite tricarboxylate transporter permease [Roseisalinus antarcticus]